MVFQALKRVRGLLANKCRAWPWRCSMFQALKRVRGLLGAP